MDDNPGAVDLELFSHSGGDDELEALEEAPSSRRANRDTKGQPVELLPRSARIRKMQHELAEHYRLKSLCCGEEPNRRCAFIQPRAERRFGRRNTMSTVRYRIKTPK
jgi:hypothetical protein